MNKDTGVNPFDQEKPRSRTITFVVVGIAILGCMCLALDVFFFFKPDQIPLIVQSLPSPTVTSTPELAATLPPNLTATQQVIGSTATAQGIEALATDSLNLWPVLLSDTFDSNKNDWIVGSSDDEFANITRKITDGKYTWDVSAKQSVIAWVAADTKAVSNFHLTVELKQVSGSDQSDYGLVFREDPDSNLYYFGIDNEGFFCLLNYDGEWTDMIEFTKSSVILPGETNRLTVIADGPHFTFFINDQYVGKMTDDHIPTGTAAVAVELFEADLQAVFEFDNFELRTP